MAGAVSYRGPLGESYFQTIYIDLSNVEWKIMDQEVPMFQKEVLFPFCDFLPEAQQQNFVDLVYNRILIIRKNFNLNIKRTEQTLNEFGTLVCIEGIGGQK